MTAHLHPVADPELERHYARDEHDQALDHFNTYVSSRLKGSDLLTGHCGAPGEGHGDVTASSWEGDAANFATTDKETHHGSKALHLRDRADRVGRDNRHRSDDLLLVAGSRHHDRLRGGDGGGDEVGGVEARREVPPSRPGHARLVDAHSGTELSPPSVPETPAAVCGQPGSRHPDADRPPAGVGSEEYAATLRRIAQTLEDLARTAPMSPLTELIASETRAAAGRCRQTARRVEDKL